MNMALEVVQNEALRWSLPMEVVSVDQIRSVFCNSGKTKEGTAATIAQIFHELQWKLPPARKPWTSEGYNTVIFDAVAAGLAYKARFNNKTFAP